MRIKNKKKGDKYAKCKVVNRLRVKLKRKFFFFFKCIKIKRGKKNTKIQNNK